MLRPRIIPCLLLKNKGLAPEAKGTSWLSTIYRQMVKGEWL